MEILVAIGRYNCNIVMENLMLHLEPGSVTHFMILHCMGTLATVNVNDIIVYVKPSLNIIIPTLGMIKHDHVKQAYAFGM